MAGAVDPACLFCRIIAGESPSEMVYQDDLVVAFRDRYPKTPTHILIVCREHIPSLDRVGEEHSGLVARIVLVANRLAREEGIADTGYRLGVNVGRWGGQMIYHLHFHLLGGRPLQGEG
ncbi:MAG: histidine triad nucleotide-binding protein [Dehalococcoidia bacterium]|nr:histidine triad nucleotide-binding protein [Dehalococcoidia bacterium]